LDGYVPGIPNRKTNIYDEGCLLAFITDILIRKNSANKHSLDDVMHYLYTEFALKNKGYSDTDYKGVVEHFANSSYDEIFNKYINGTSDYESVLKDAMNYIGCELTLAPSGKFHEHAVGIKIQEVNGLCKVTAVYPGSVADTAGITVNDDILSINNMQIKTDNTGTNFSEWCTYFGNVQLILTIATNGIIKQITLQPKPNAYYKIAQMKKQTAVNEQQKNNFETWSKNKF
jgi:predicted metalloprotease with PDZ domain